MREIKFRAWDDYGEQMQYLDDYTVLDGRGKFKTFDGPDLTTQKHDWLVMQYTGLKDAKGREIHEGDVVSLQHEFAGLGEPKEELFEVEYSEKRAGFIPFCVMRECTDEIGNYQISGQDVEVIGNIYENPELIEQRKGEK
jgi:uncharacterized phage protein (TIGR01671 family)